MSKSEKFQPVRNEALYRAMSELRRSSAASPHQDRRTRRARTRQDARRAAVRDSDAA